MTQLAEFQSADRQHLPAALARAAIIAGSYWLLSLSLTVATGSFAAVAGCIAACVLTGLPERENPLKRLRTPVILIAAAFLAITGMIAGNLITGSNLAATLFGPVAAFHLAEGVKWLCFSFALTGAVRVLAVRSSAGGIIEVLLVATGFVIILSAHRNGMINRPFFLGDFALSRGLDPATILLVLGCGAVLCLSALLLVEENRRRLPYHFALFGLLCLSLIGYVQTFGLPTPQMTDDLGLTGNSAQRRENPFHDGENNTENKQAPVAIVVFRDDYEPDGGAYYFRESAYSQWNGYMLDFTSLPDMDRDLIAAPGAPARETVSSEGRRLVSATIGTLVPHRSPFGLDAPIAFENAPNPNNLRFKRTWDAHSLVPEFDLNEMLGRPVGDPDWSAEVRQEYLRLPDDPRYGELAREIIGGLRPQYADDPFARAWAVKNYLDRNGIYSLANEHAYAEDPAASFLFGDLTGYCMHFAFASTYMLRSLGIPARVGIGYSVPAANRAGGSSLLIQAIHGHAWPEIYFEGYGWVIVDPAPQRTLVDMTTDPQNELQQLLGDMLRGEAAFEEFLQEQAGFTINWQLVLSALPALLAALVLAGYAVKIYRLWIPAAAGLAAQHRLSYRAALDRLAAVGVRRRFGESREAFAHRASATAPALETLTAWHLAHALGERPPSLGIEDWNAARRRVSGEIRGNTGTGKRILAILNPFSWLRAK